MTKNNSTNYQVAIYIRLSKEDENKQKDSESESIINQRSLLLSYISDNNLVLKEEYVDDGYSGTTFNRPSFNRMISDIENGKINIKGTPTKRIQLAITTGSATSKNKNYTQPSKCRIILKIIFKTIPTNHIITNNNKNDYKYYIENYIKNVIF